MLHKAKKGSAGSRPRSIRAPGSPRPSSCTPRRSASSRCSWTAAPTGSSGAGCEPRRARCAAGGGHAHGLRRHRRTAPQGQRLRRRRPPRRRHPRLRGCPGAEAGHPAALVGLAQAWIAHDQPERAIVPAQVAVEVDEPGARTALARALILTGRGAEALPVLRAQDPSGPSSPRRCSRPETSTGPSRPRRRPSRRAGRPTHRSSRRGCTPGPTTASGRCPSRAARSRRPCPTPWSRPRPPRSSVTVGTPSGPRPPPPPPSRSRPRGPTRGRPRPRASPRVATTRAPRDG